jgi:hypothetical protein
MSRIISYQLYPSGYQSPLYDTVRTGSNPDELVVKAYKELRVSMSSHVNTWEYRRKIINRGLDLFGYLRDWLEAQEKNERVTKHMRAFIEDTLTFITTGRRPMALESRWECILQEKRSTGEKRTSNQHKTKLSQALSVPYEDYMWHWLSHPNGFTDMVCTLNVIFGMADGDA